MSAFPMTPADTWPSQIEQASVAVNLNALRLQLLLGRLLSNTTAAQPGSPADGDAYILPASPTGTQWGTFAQHDVVIFRSIDGSGTWYRFAPVNGLVLNVDGALWRYTGSTWVLLAGTATISANLSADQNNYAPTGHAAAALLRLAPQTVDRTVTGLAGGSINRRITIVNTAAALNLVLAHESASSSASNRFLCPGAANLTLAPGATRDAVYDGTSSRWRVVG